MGPFALLSNWKIFHTAANDIKVLKFSCEVPDILSALNHMWNFLTDFRKIPHKFRVNPSGGNGANCATVVGQTDICAERHVRPFLLLCEQAYKAFSLS